MNSQNERAEAKRENTQDHQAQQRREVRTNTI